MLRLLATGLACLAGFAFLIAVVLGLFKGIDRVVVWWTGRGARLPDDPEPLRGGNGPN